MNVKKLILPLLLTAVGTLAFAQNGGEPEAPATGNMYVGVGSEPDTQGEPNPLLKGVYREDYLQGKEAGWRGELDTVWIAPAAQTDISAGNPAAFNTETAYVYTLKQDFPLTMTETSYRVADHEPNGEMVNPSSDGGDTPADYISWKGRVDFKFIKEMTDNGPVLKIVSHVANPHGVRFEKAAIKVKDNKDGVTVEIKLPKAPCTCWIGQSLTLKYKVINLKQLETERKVKTLMRK